MRGVWAHMIVLAGSLLASCDSTYTRADGADQVGNIHPQVGPSRQNEGLLPNCGDDGRRDHGQDLEFMRSSIESWYEVLRHLEDCDVGQLRYYGSRRFEGNFRNRLSQVAASSGPECRAQASHVEMRIGEILHDLREWTGIAAISCSTELSYIGLSSAQAELTEIRRGIDCLMRDSFGAPSSYCR